MPSGSRSHHDGAPSSTRRGHTAQLSISDDNHHVTEAIGDMYGDHHYSRQESRPLSFVSSSTPPPTTSPLSPRGSQSSQGNATYRHSNARNPLGRTTSNERVPSHVGGPPIGMLSRSGSEDSENGAKQLSPSNSLRREPSASETANAHFPLNDIDYESNPNAIAQELNNLSALRRMSMDVNASGDPDLPAFSANFGIPTTPPVGSDPDDAARLYWVPASVHPELAPMEFKTFLDKKVNSLKRRSQEKQSGLSPDNLDPDGASASLRRRKSMLSRQIDNTDGRGAEGYQDGAERLDRRRSQNTGELLNTGINSLQNLEVLVSEPSMTMQRLSLESGNESPGRDSISSDDMPILPGAPSSSNSLKRSTRTTYRRGGSLRRGERTPFSKRAAQLGGHDVDEDPIPSNAASRSTGQESYSLTRSQTEPTPEPSEVAENFSRPGRQNRRAGMASPVPQAHQYDYKSPQSSIEVRPQPQSQPIQQPRHFVSQIASNGRIGVPLGKPSAIPAIIATPPQPDYRPPERTSSHAPRPLISAPNSSPSTPSAHRSQNWTSQSRTNQSIKPNQSLNDMTAHPSPLPGNNTRTDSLSFIPTLTEDKKADTKKSKDKKERDSDGARKSSWSWGSLLGNEEKEKEKRKEEEAKEARKAKAKVNKQVEKSYDSTRLDLLQTTMEGSRGRESLVLDRGDVRLEEERKKESTRKLGIGEAKKEKEAGFFSNLLGGKKKGDRDAGMKKHYSRNLSPDPPMRILKPDIDYNWTRFSILEERAIYRMAHIKLANPRRALHSQVLLSNFMYSYLAKVQQMHPQANIPQRGSAAQNKKDQPEEFLQYQKYQEQQQRQQELEEQHAIDDQSGANSDLIAHQQHDNFMDMNHDYDAPETDEDSQIQSRQSQHVARPSEASGYVEYSRQSQRQGIQHDSKQISSYAYQQDLFEDNQRSQDDDMW